MEKFSEKKNIKSFLTSAKNGTNIELVFKEIAQLILGNKTDEEINEEFGLKPRSLSSLSHYNNQLQKKKKKCC